MAIRGFAHRPIWGLYKGHDRSTMQWLLRFLHVSPHSPYKGLEPIPFKAMQGATMEGHCDNYTGASNLHHYVYTRTFITQHLNGYTRASIPEHYSGSIGASIRTIITAMYWTRSQTTVIPGQWVYIPGNLMDIYKSESQIMKVTIYWHRLYSHYTSKMPT
jgi:hypothetical protein